MISHVSKVATPSAGWIASSTPAAVATPLPPWNLKNTGYKWPRNTAMAASAIAVLVQPEARAEMHDQPYRQPALERVAESA